jgi:hypothetical protein
MKYPLIIKTLPMLVEKLLFRTKCPPNSDCHYYASEPVEYIRRRALRIADLYSRKSKNASTTGENAMDTDSYKFLKIIA